jgi:hypothetical protein
MPRRLPPYRRAAIHAADAAGKLQRDAQAFAAEVTTENLHRIEQRHRRRAPRDRDVERPHRIAEFDPQTLGNVAQDALDTDDIPVGELIEFPLRAGQQAAQRIGLESSFEELLRREREASGKKEREQRTQIAQALDAALRQRRNRCQVLLIESPGARLFHEPCRLVLLANVTPVEPVELGHIEDGATERNVSDIETVD